MKAAPLPRQRIAMQPSRLNASARRPNRRKPLSKFGDFEFES
jgi:hypothetical protein